MIEFLKGKKTYIMVILAFIYGGGIQIGLWAHYPLVDTALAGGTVASLRAGIAKAEVAKLIVICWLLLGLSGCAGQQFGGSYTDQNGNSYSGSVKMGPRSPLHGFAK